MAALKLGFRVSSVAEQFLLNMAKLHGFPLFLTQFGSV